MNCPECDRVMQGDTCACGFTTKKTKKPDFYAKECATEGCYVLIGTRIGQPIDPPICKWCQAGTAYYSGKPGAMQKKG